MNTKKQSVILTELERDRTQLAPKAPIVAYVRVSSDEQARKKTIDAQKSEVEAWANARGLRLARVVADDGHSGTTISGRPGFSKLLAEVAAGKVGTLVVVAPDRLTRAEDWNDRAQIMGALKAHRTLLVMTGYGDFDPTAETADMMLSNFFVLSSMERKRLRARTFAGKVRAADLGRLSSGRPPFARYFDKATGKWAVNEEEAKLYQRLFALCLEGKSGRDTARVLTAEGAPTPHGSARWRSDVVSQLLRAESATGAFSQLGRPVQIPPIVDRATWEKARQLVEARRASHGPFTSNARLLTGLLTCAECGAGVHVRDKGNGLVYYLFGTSHTNWTQRTSRDRPPCSKVWHKAQPLEEALWAEVSALLRDPAKLERAAGLKSSKKSDDDGVKEVAAAERELKATDREEENLMRLYRRGLASETALERQLAEVQRNRKTAQQALNNAKAAQHARAHFEATGIDLASKVKALAKNVQNATPEQQRAVMSGLFQRAAGGGLKLHLDGAVRGSGMLSFPSVAPVSNAVATSKAPAIDTKGKTGAYEPLTFRLNVGVKRRKAS